MVGVSGGAAAARAVGLAADVIESVARRSEDWAEAGATIAQARALAARAAALAEENETAFADALARPGIATLERSMEVPLRIADLAVDAALLADATAGRCDGRFRADAGAAALLAESAARIVEHLVSINLAVRPGDDELARARLLAETVRAAAARAVDTSE
jgi:hypothetical protein